MTHTPSPVFSEKLSPLANDGIKHAFFTREGGVSSGIYSSLNVGKGSDDKLENVIENRRIVATFMETEPEKLITVYQVHSSRAVIVDEPFKQEPPKADALVTSKRGLALGVLTADCGPVLFTDPKAGVIAAAHAGWRGALGGVLEDTIATMETLGAQRNKIIAVLGPCIGPKNYEVTDEFRKNFTDENSFYSNFFVKTDDQDHYLFNLWEFILYRLRQSQVNADCVEMCTYADEKRFFSYRRKTHRNEPDFGRQISTIMLENR